LVIKQEDLGPSGLERKSQKGAACIFLENENEKPPWRWRE
jgi:hypothetical protein